MSKYERRARECLGRYAGDAGLLDRVTHALEQSEIDACGVAERAVRLAFELEGEGVASYVREAIRCHQPGLPGEGAEGGPDGRHGRLPGRR